MMSEPLPLTEVSESSNSSPSVISSRVEIEQQPILPPLVILNPVGGQGKARHLQALIESKLAGGRAELVLTARPGDGERLAREAALAGRNVVAVGGDGTVAEIGNGILASGQRVSMGVVPCGSGNDYAYQTLKLPHDPATALDIALNGTPQAMDVGEVNGRYFLNSLGVGIDANIAAAAEQLKGLPLMRGQMLYWGASLRELLFHYDQCPELTVSCDEEPGESRLFALAAVSIGPTYGGGFHINPNADPRDGYFTVCAIWKPPLGRALRLLPMIEKGRHLREPEVSFRNVRSIILTARKPIYAHLDGEVITAERFEAHIRPAALLVRQ